MSAGQHRTGVTAREHAEALADTPLHEPVDYPHPSEPRFGWGAPDIQPAFGEPRKEQQ